MNLLPILAGGFETKLYENDPLEFFVSKPLIFAILVFALGFCAFVVLNFLYLYNNVSTSKLNRRGITAFRGVILGDSILLPLIAYLQGKFYQQANATAAGSWLIYDWIPWLCIGAAVVYSFYWLHGVTTHPKGDWTSIPPTRHDVGGVNLFGVWHFLFYVGIVSTWIIFGVKSFGYLITVDHPGNLIALQSLTVIAILGFLGLLLWDYRSEPHWPWEKAMS